MVVVVVVVVVVAVVVVIRSHGDLSLFSTVHFRCDVMISHAHTVSARPSCM